MENHKIRVAITQGDTNGIGLELIFKTFAEPEMLELCTPIIYGSPKVASYHSNVLQTQCQFSIISNVKDVRDGKVNLIPCFDEEVKVEFGQPTNEAAVAGVKALDRALADSREGRYDVLVCGPMNSGVVQMKPFNFPGTVKYIETSIGEGQKAEPIHLNDILRVALATKGSVKDIALTKELIVEKVKTLHNSLKRDFNVSTPRIAVLALNPVAGIEEKEIIAPAITELAESKIQVFGAYQADELFSQRKYDAFDAILAMHHDQGLLPLRMLSDSKSTILLANLPLVCSIVDCDAQHQIAGKNIADEAILRNAIYVAIDACRNRVHYDEPMQNPLPKLYHERPDDGEKLRFSIPKKREQKEN